MDGLVGRTDELRSFSNLLTGPSNVRIVNISGLAGVGKSTLAEYFADLATRADTAVALVNARRLVDVNDIQRYAPAIEALILISQAFRKRHAWMRRFTNRLKRYRYLHRKLTQQFDGAEEHAVTTMLQVGVSAVRAGSTILPIAGPLKSILTPELASKVGRAIATHRRNSDRELLEEPIGQLSEVFVEAVNAILQKKSRLLLIFDEYELCSPQLDYWLRRLMDGAYGTVNGRMLLVVAGRQPLGQDWTARGRGGAPDEILHLPLSRFTHRETAQYLIAALPELSPDDADRIARELSETYRLPLILRLLVDQRSFSRELSNPMAVPPSLGLLQGELVKRLLNADFISNEQCMATLLTGVSRSFDAQIFTVATQDNSTTQFEWIISQHFINPHAPLYTYYDVVRGILLSFLSATQPETVLAAHLRLAEFFELRASDSARTESQRIAALEAVYHRLSCSSGNLLAEALQDVMVILPAAYQDCANWSAMLLQVADEREYSEVDVRPIRRLASVLWQTHRLSTPSGLERFELAAADPAMNILFASSFDSEHPEISEADAELWLTYFECRVKVVVGETSDIEVARHELLRAWNEAENISALGVEKNLLKFRIATDLADIFNRQGDLARAQHHSRVAVSIARTGASPTRHGFALYQLSNNQKRAGQYSAALRNLNRAIAMIRENPSRHSRYYLGRFMLDKAITLTYMNDTPSAERAYEESREYFADTSPLSHAELSHRIGWLKRVRGDLNASLRDHETAVTAFRRLHAAILTPTSPISSTSYLLAKALHSMGNVYAEMCQHRDALECYSEAQRIFSRQGGVRHEAIVRKDKAWSVLQVAGFKAAEEELIRAITDLGLQVRSGQRPPVNSNTHLTEGWLYLSILRTCVGQLDPAAEAAIRGRQLVEGDRDNPPILARIRAQEALLAALRGEPGEMDRLCTEATAYALAHMPPLRQITATALLARAVYAAQTGDAAGAARWLDSSRREITRWNEYAPHALEERVRYFALRGTDPDQSVLSLQTLTGGNASSTEEADVDEIIDVYDENGDWIGQASRRLAHTAGLWHRSFHCWILSRSVETGAWMILLQERGPYSRNYPNYLDMSSAGHYRAGEGIDGGVRECQEELGIQVEASELTLVAKRVVNERVDDGSLNREFQDICLLVRPSGLGTYRPAFPEVTAIYECAIDDLVRLVNEEVSTIPATGRRAAGDGLQFEPIEGPLTLDRFIPAAREYHKVLLCAASRYILGDRGGATSGEKYELPDGSHWKELS